MVIIDLWLGKKSIHGSWNLASNPEVVPTSSVTQGKVLTPLTASCFIQKTGNLIYPLREAQSLLSCGLARRGAPQNTCSPPATSPWRTVCCECKGCALHRGCTTEGVGGADLQLIHHSSSSVPLCLAEGAPFSNLHKSS